MVRVGEFEKVSLQQFEKDMLDTFDFSHEEGDDRTDLEIIQVLYDALKQPKRATKGSAGYDICTPMAFVLEPGQSIKIPTGLRVFIEDGWHLKLYPRSSLGFKYRLQLDNTVGVVDSDYFNSDNEGHIFIKITNDSRDEQTVEVQQGEAFAQAVFEPFGITYTDRADGERNGGFGSTNPRGSEEES